MRALGIPCLLALACSALANTAAQCRSGGSCWSSRTQKGLREEVGLDERSVQLLQHTRGRRERDSAGFFNVSAILADSPPGTFLSKMAVLVQAVGLTYNTTTPEYQSELENASIVAGDDTWSRDRRFDRDPEKGGVFARVFVNEARRSVIVAFKGICQAIGTEQCVIDACEIVRLNSYGNLTSLIAKMFGADEETCGNYSDKLNYVQQGLGYAHGVRDALGGDYEFIMTGHSLGGLLAIVTAAQMGLKALTFAPTPFHSVLQKELNFSDAQIANLQSDDLVATCDPFDCGINSVYVDDARGGAKTCLYMDTREPLICSFLSPPYEAEGWREDLATNESDVGAAAHNLLCKISAHQWVRYEEIVLARGEHGEPSNLPVCNTDYSVLEEPRMSQNRDFLHAWLGSYRPI